MCARRYITPNGALSDERFIKPIKKPESESGI